ncbi:MAG: hypothetical protein U1C33_08080, partial [Candidatus Cloacimonadaceae bacterium]|nr:hypothetical protein [Candidatus Cloacimonadaceae bacterium]
QVKKLFLLLLIMFAMIGACTIKHPNLPEWDITLNVPLINEKYYMRDLVDSVNIIADTTDVVYLRSEGEVSTPNFGDVSFSLDFSSESIPLLAGQTYHGYVDVQDPDSDNELVYGVLSVGVLQSRFNRLDSSTSVSITFPDIRMENGSPFVFSPPANSGWEEYSLEGFRIGALNSGIILSQLQYFITISSSQPNGTPVGDLELNLSQRLQFSVFEGKLPGHRIDMNESTTTVDVEYPFGLENAIQLLEADLYLRLYNRIGFELEFHGEFYAVNNHTGQHRTIPILDANGDHFIISPAIGDQPSITNIEFSNNVNVLISIMPEHIELRNSYFIVRSGAASSIGMVKEADFIDGFFTIDAPFRFILLAERIIVRNEADIEISGSNQNRIRDNLMSAEMDIDMINNFPFGATVELFFGNSPTIDVDDPTTWNFKKSLHFHSNQMNDGMQSFVLQLTKEELETFTRPHAYLRWAFTFDESITPITITASPMDYIHIKSMIRSDIHVQGGSK